MGNWPQIVKNCEAEKIRRGFAPRRFALDPLTPYCGGAAARGVGGASDGISLRGAMLGTLGVCVT